MLGGCSGGDDDSNVGADAGDAGAESDGGQFGNSNGGTGSITGPGETATFKAIGVFANGERDVTTQVVWSLGDAELGELQDGEFTSAGFGGETTVHARAQGVEASAELSVMLEVQAQSDGAPDGI